MVGHRCAELLAERAQRTARPVRITVLGEEPRPAYDRVHLTSLFDGASTEELDLPRAAGGRAASRRPGDRDRPRRADRHHGLRRRLPLRRAGAGHRLVPVRAAGAGPRRDRLLRLPHHRGPARRSRQYAAGRRIGAVVGGGLLGLEAAGALQALGLDTHVVEFAPRLMPVQVDEGGGRRCGPHIEELGVTVHTVDPHRGGGDRRGRRGVRARAGRRARISAPCRRTWSSSPPVSGRATSSAASAGLPGRRARRHRGRRALPHRRPADLRDRRVRAGRRRPGVRPGRARLRDGRDGRRPPARRGPERRSPAPTCPPSSSCSAWTSPPSATRSAARPGALDVALQRRPRRALQEAGRSPRTARCSAASWSATPRRTRRCARWPVPARRCPTRRSSWCCRPAPAAPARSARPRCRTRRRVLLPQRHQGRDQRARSTSRAAPTCGA